MAKSPKKNPAKSCQTMPKAAESCQTTPNSADEPQSDPSELKPNQQRALVALLEAPSIAAAARQTGLGERTLHRWLHEDPNFQTELRKKREQYLAHSATRLQTASNQAVQTLVDLLASKDHIEPGRAALVRTALDFAFRAGSYIDLAERIEEVEEAARRSEEEGRGKRSSKSDSFIQDPAA